MENKKENEAAIVARPVYKPLPLEYRPYNASESQKRSLERVVKKKRSKRST